MPSVPHAALPASRSAGCRLLLLPIELARAQTGAPDSAPPAVAQRDLMDLLAKVLGRTKTVVDSHPPLVLSVLPAFSVNPAYGVLFRVATTALLRLGPPPATSASTAGVTVGYTTKQQFNVVARANISARRTSSCFRVTGGTWTPRSPQLWCARKELEDNLEYG